MQFLTLSLRQYSPFSVDEIVRRSPIQVRHPQAQIPGTFNHQSRAQPNVGRVFSRRDRQVPEGDRRNRFIKRGVQRSLSAPHTSEINRSRRL